MELRHTKEGLWVGTLFYPYHDYLIIMPNSLGNYAICMVDQKTQKIYYNNKNYSINDCVVRTILKDFLQ